MSKKFNRRYFLTQSGILLALPHLESLFGWTNRALAQAAPRRQRFIGCFMPNGSYCMQNNNRGRNNGTWKYGNDGVLQLLRDQGLDVNTMVIRGAGFRSRTDQHLFGTSGFLNGEQPAVGRQGSGYRLRGGESMDQMIAKKIQAEDTRPVSSLQLGWRYGEHPAFNGRAHQYYINAISWKTPSEPLLPIYSPARVFDSLFAPSANERMREYIYNKNKSVLDYVMAEIKTVRGKLSQDDKLRLERYVTQIRELEKDLQKPEGTCQAPNPSRYDLIVNYEDHWRKMNELLVLAMQCDLTRVATIMYSNGTGDVYANHHAVAHGAAQGKNNFIEQQLAINRTQLGLWADLVTRLKNADLLDDTILVYGSNMSHGMHGRSNIPFLVAGGGDGLNWGQDIGQPTADRPYAGLYVDLLKMYGIQINSLGHSEYRGRGGEFGIFS